MTLPIRLASLMSDTRPEWLFDDTEIPDPFGFGNRAVRFVRALRHPKSRLPLQGFYLAAWQERLIRRIYGPCDEHGNRLAKTVFVMLPRGNRKTALGAALSLLHCVGPERIPGGQCIAAAADRKQARLAYTEACGIVGAVPQLDRAMKIVDSRNRIEHRGSGSVLEAISCDAGTQHGRTPSFVLADELHAWKKRELWDVLRTGLVKTVGSLTVIITTAGRGQANVAFELYQYAKRVASGEIDDPGFLPVLFEADRDADWRDESVWQAVNPGLSDGFLDLQGLRQLAREAENRPADREAFRQLHLNMWLDNSVAPFLDMQVYDEGALPIDLDALAASGAACFVAVDASTTTDLTCVLACFVVGDEFHIAPMFFVPENNLRRRGDRDRVPYPLWANDGFIVATPGDVIDFAAVELHIRELCERFGVVEIAFDPAYSRQISLPLVEAGLPVVEMRQGWRTMGPAIADLERAVIGRKLRHGGNPVLRWCFENVALHDDGKGNRSFHKGKSRDRIDGAVAAAMAVSRASQGAANSVLDDVDFNPEKFVVSI